VNLKQKAPSNKGGTVLEFGVCCFAWLRGDKKVTCLFIRWKHKYDTEIGGSCIGLW